MTTTDSTNQTWLQKFSLFFYDRREMTYLFWAAIVVFGIFSYTTLLKRQGFPHVDVPITIISGTYFANDREEVDRQVTQPASEIISGLPDVKTVTSLAGENSFSMTVEFQEGQTTSSAGAREVRAALGDRLPADAQMTFKPIDAAKYAEQSDLLISIYNDSNLQTLEKQAQDIAAYLSERDGVARASVLKAFETGTDSVTGQPVTIKQSFDRLVFRQNGEVKAHEPITIGVTATPNKDALELSDEVKQTLTELGQLPAYQNTQMRVSADLAEGVRAQISNLEVSLLQGLAAVLVVSLLLISARASMTGALSMITVLLMTLGIMHLIGYTLNTVTLFALILSLGLIVDDTTIVVEAIDAAKRESRFRRKIIADSIKWVARASTAGTFTTMLGFAPMLFVSGILGDFIRILPVTIMISLAVSLIVSLTLVPFLSSRLILRSRVKMGLRDFRTVLSGSYRSPQKLGLPRRGSFAGEMQESPAAGAGELRFPRAQYESPHLVTRVEKSIANKLARLLLVGKRSAKKGRIISASAIGLSIVSVIIAIPLMQRLTFDIFPATKDTDAIRVSLRFAPGTSLSQAEAITDSANQRIVDTLGDNLRRITYQNSGSASGAVATVDLIHYKERESTSQQLIQELDQEFQGFPQAAVQVSQVDVGPPREELPFSVQVTSKDRGAALVLARDIRIFLEGSTIMRSSGKPALITRAEIATPEQIRRVDGQETIEVQAGFDATDTSALVTAAQEAVEAEFNSSRLIGYGLEPDVMAFDFGAESGNQESFRSMLYALPFLLLAMYLLMAAQFRSLIQPLLIFLAVPFGFLGVAVGLHMTGNPLSFFVLVGLFALIGIVVNNTIMLTDYANQARRFGLTHREAMAVAVAARFRPLVTTSLTTIVALIPLALMDPFWESLSVTLIFGLLSSTFLVIIAFPYYYLAGEASKPFARKLWHRKLPQAAQYPLDILIAPVRVAHLVVYIAFRHKS